jgi:hypothetical protein
VALHVGSSTHDWGARQIDRTGEPPRHLALAMLLQQELSCLFQLKRQTMPHSSTWNRVLGQWVSPEEFEQALGQFFAGQKWSQMPKRGSIRYFWMATRCGNHSCRAEPQSALNGRESIGARGGVDADAGRGAD